MYTHILTRGTRHTPEGHCVPCEDALIHEHCLAVTINGSPFLELSCTPSHLREMVLGRLFTEGVIGDLGQVKDIAIDEAAGRAEVTLAEGADPSNRRKPEALQPVDPDPSAVFALAKRFKEDSALHRSTNGAHTCYLRLPEGEVRAFEDLSRHNALDKAVGAMLAAGADPAKCVIYTTGRVPADMTIKLVMARVPVLVSKAVPTDAGVSLAAKYGLTLLCRAWPDSYVRYQGTVI